MTNSKQKFYLYNDADDTFLVEFLFGGNSWLKEGDLDSVPRVWTFTEEEIIEKFGEDHLKYKKTIEEIDLLRNRQTENSDAKTFYRVNDRYYRNFEHAKEKVLYDIARHISDEDAKRFVSDELNKLKSIDVIEKSIDKDFDRSMVSIRSLFRGEMLGIEIHDNEYLYSFSICSYTFED